MLNEKNTNNFQKMEDSDLEGAVGGYLQVSRWRSYASTNLVPLITAQLGSADNVDKAILNRVYSAIQGTMIPGASVAGAISQLSGDYYANRGNIHSDAVRQALDTVVNLASSYLAANAWGIAGPMLHPSQSFPLILCALDLLAIAAVCVLLRRPGGQQ